MRQAKYNISQAARIIGMSRATITRDAKKGKLSLTIDEDGKWVAGAELARVYREKCDFDRVDKKDDTRETQRSDTGGGDSGALHKLQERLIEKYEQDNAQLKELLEKALDYQTGVTKLIEDRSQDTEKWQRLLDDTREKIANETAKEIRNLQDQHKEELLRLKRALHKERRKSWWDKLWGREPNNHIRERNIHHARQGNRT